MRILSFNYSDGGCWWIRLKMPLEQLAKKHLVALTNGVTRHPVGAFQIIIFNNIPHSAVANGKEVTVAQMVADFKKIGAKIVYDTDDSHDVHPLNGYLGKMVDDNLHAYYTMLKEADLITTTTEQLKQHLQKFTDKPIKVLPNCINPELFKERRRKDRVKIGFAGSFSHIPDLDLVMPAIESLKEKHKIYFETLGFQKGTHKWKKPVTIEKYYDALADLGADIGICPLLDNEFNRNKSPLKFLEYSMTGSMVLASNRYPYKGEMKDEWLVDDDKWEETLEKYILDKDLREKTLKEQREWVLANRDIRKESIRWEQEYRNLLK